MALNQSIQTETGGSLPSFDDFMAATPDERKAYLTADFGPSTGAKAAALNLRNITMGANSNTPLSADQYNQILASSGLDPQFAQQVSGELGATLDRQARDAADNSVLKHGALAALGVAGAGLGANALLASGAGGGGAAAGAGTLMPAAQALSPEALGAMGLTEIAPGVWSASGAGASLGLPALGGAESASGGGTAAAAPGAAPAAAPGGGAPEALGIDPNTGFAAANPVVDPATGFNVNAGAGGTVGSTTGASTAAAASGGVTGVKAVDDALSWMKTNAVGLTGLGIGAAASLKKPPQIPNEQTINALGQQGAAVANQLIGQYQSGNLSAGQQASLDQLTQQTKARISNYFASIGQSDSTAAQQALAQVDQQAATMKQQILDNTLQQGLQAIGVAQGPLNTVANYQIQEDKNLREAFGTFAGQVGQFAGRTSGAVQNTTVAPTVTSTGTAGVTQ